MRLQTTKYALVIVLLFLLSSPYMRSQEINDGIYFMIDEKKCVFKKVKIKDSSSSICIPNSPIFPIEDIISVSELETDVKADLRKLFLRLSESGSERLSMLSKIYLGEELVFIFDNRAVFLFKIDRAITSGKISLEENIDNTSLALIQEAIKKLLLRGEHP